eukprot:15365875-Ditylum_brightwellii.AAC.2
MEEERSIKRNANISNNSNCLASMVPTNSLTSIAGPTADVTTTAQDAGHQQMDIFPSQHSRIKWVTTQIIVKHDGGGEMRFDVAVIY